MWKMFSYNRQYLIYLLRVESNFELYTLFCGIWILNILINIALEWVPKDFLYAKITINSSNG